MELHAAKAARREERDGSKQLGCVVTPQVIARPETGWPIGCACACQSARGRRAPEIEPTWRKLLHPEAARR